MDNRPRVTVGMPVYNGAHTLGPVLESIIRQSYERFRLVISDNSSTDTTEAICRELASSDPRVSYIRQPENIGAEANFNFVLAKADTEYFMWAAADDCHSNDFIKKKLGFLDNNPDFLGSTCPVRFESAEYDPIRMGDGTRDEPDQFERILKFFEAWHANGRFYSLFKTDAVRKAGYSQRRFMGADWLLIIEVLYAGKLKRLDSGCLEFGRKGISNSLEAFSQFRVRWVYWFIPFFDVSLRVIRLFKPAHFKQKLRLMAILLRFNLMAFKLQIRYEIDRIYLKFRKTRNQSAGLNQV